MYVFRVENKKGEGPYRNEAGIDSHLWGDEPHWGGDKHPSPYDDGVPHYSTKHIFGFITMGQLLAWFSTEELAKLSRLGFYPRIVKAKGIIRGYSQYRC